VKRSITQDQQIMRLLEHRIHWRGVVQRSEALRQYRQCAEMLEAELSTPPEEATTRLYAECRAGEELR
jgi:hypothetical protein